MKIEINHLTKSFARGFRAVDDLSFSFSSGEVIGFVGPNGAGKTTTMRILATLDVPDSGDILIDGTSILDNPDLAHRMIGYMPDDLPDRNDITVDEYLDFFGRAYRLRDKQLRDAVESVEEFTGLTSFKDKTLRALSKGMKQRVSLARALVHDPQLVVMDEPANGLDPRARRTARTREGPRRKRQGDPHLLAHPLRTRRDVHLERHHRTRQAPLDRPRGGQ